MGIPVLVMGESGSGKSASLRNFAPGEIGIMSVAGKPLPFRNEFKCIPGPGYEDIKKVLERNKLRAYAIDDSQYLMTFESFRRAKEVGYGKFTDMAVNFYNLIQCAINKTTPDTVVYFLHHNETGEDGKQRAKTLGKMLTNQLTVEGLFSIVLLCVADDKTHKFITQSGGYSTAKSPIDMLPAEMDNDLKAVDTAIREYYNLIKEENTNGETE